MTTTSEHGAATPPDTEGGGLGFSHRRIVVTMSSLAIAMLLAMLDNMIVAPALPTIVGELGGLEHLAWVATGYILATTVATPIWGKLGDLFGRRIVFVSAIGVFLVGSILCGVSQDMGQLIAFRAVQGLGAGGLIVGVMSILGEMIPPRERGKYQGIMMAVMPVAMIAGPFVGGYITDNLDWRWAFYVNLPLGAVALVICWITLRTLPKGTGGARIDWTGTGLLAVWITALVLVISWGGTDYDWDSPQILGLAALAVAGFAAFIIVERRVAEPVMPLRVFKSRNFALASAISFIAGFAMFGAVGYLPQFQQFVQGSSATNSGLLLMPMMIAAMVVSVGGGIFISRTGRYKALPVGGTVLVTIGLFLFSTVDVDTGVIATGVYMVVLGIGLGGLMQTSTLIAQNSVALRDIGAGTGAVTFMRNMGSSIGVALLGAIYTHQLIGSLEDAGADGAAIAAGANSMTPELLRGLPDAAVALFQRAVTEGIASLFLWGAVASVLGIVAAVLVRHVPLRTGKKPEPEPEPEEADAATRST